MTIALLEATIDSYIPNSMTDEDDSNLSLMLTLDAFKSLHGAIRAKLEDYQMFLRRNPRCDFGEPAKETSTAGPSMTFRIVNGLLVPVKP